jgi:hypothetical protein
LEHKSFDKAVAVDYMVAVAADCTVVVVADCMVVVEDNHLRIIQIIFIFGEN